MYNHIQQLLDWMIEQHIDTYILTPDMIIMGRHVFMEFIKLSDFRTLISTRMSTSTYGSADYTYCSIPIQIVYDTPYMLSLSPRKTSYDYIDQRTGAIRKLYE